MPITSNDLRNIPIDQIGLERPLLKRCLAKRKLFFGARQPYCGERAQRLLQSFYLGLWRNPCGI